MTSASDFDQATYHRDVIEPALARQMAPRDLVVRYAITGECTVIPAAFSKRVGEVKKYWRSIQQQRRYKKLVDELMVAHDDLAAGGQLSYAAFVRRRDEDRARAAEHLETRARDLAAMTEVAGPDMLDALRAETGWLLPEGDIRAAVRRHGVSIADEPWELPARPDRHCRDLARELTTLGLTLAAEAVFDAEAVRGGFRLRNGFRLNSGDQLSAAVIDQKKQRLARSSLGTRKTAMETVLTTLQRAAAQPAGLDQLLLWQLIDTLEARLAAGHVPVSLARAARELGLDPAEASMLALAIYTFRQPARGALRKQVETALKDGQLRAAQDLVAGLPPDSDIAQQVAARLQRIEKQLAEAGQAEDRGQREQAASVLAQILATDYDTDGQLAWRLRGLVPPPPAEVTATPGQGQVLLTWRPGPARPGEVTYRVVRQTDAPAPTWAAGTLVAQTGEQSATDVAPPAGERLHYAVFASRGRDLWSAGAAAEVILLPDVADLRLEALPSAVLGSWRVAPGTSEVMVTRAEGEPPPAGREQHLPATLAGFTDTGVQPGQRYFYRVCAVYLSAAGERLASPGVLCDAIPEPDPVPVGELRATVPPGPVPEAALSWVAPPASTVTIYQHAAPPPWPAGTVLRHDELARLGRPVAGVPGPGEPGDSRATVALASGRTWFTAVTCGVGRAVLGATAEASAMAAVRDLQARRYGTGIQLSWDWPDGCHECQVGWRQAGSQARAAEPAICGDWEFRNRGGFLVEAGPDPVTVWVRAILRTPAGLIESAAQEAEVPGADVIIWYRFHPPRRWRPGRRARLVLTASRACELPALVVVRDGGRPDGGEPVFRTRAMSLAPARPAHVPVPGWRPGDRLACAPGAEQGGISLVRSGGAP